jgi:Pyridoxamine 5'-phosphate oxidase
VPAEVEEAFRRFVTAEFTTIDSHGRPITWPVVPFYSEGSLAVTTALGMPRKAEHARRNPRVALLFSDATGAGIERPSMILVQGTAVVDDADLDANRQRYRDDTAAKPTGPAQPPPARGHDWYFTRIYIHVEPERMYVWRDGDVGARPDVYGDLSRAGAPEERSRGGVLGPGRRIAEVGSRYETAVLSLVTPDGYPFSVRVPMTADRRGRSIAIDVEPTGAELHPGPVCVTAHDHDPELRWTRNFQVRGGLLRDEHGWVVLPHRLVGGFELPPTGSLVRAVTNIPKIRRFRKTAARERRRRRAD